MPAAKDEDPRGEGSENEDPPPDDEDSPPDDTDEGKAARWAVAAVLLALVVLSLVSQVFSEEREVDGPEVLAAAAVVMLAVAVVAGPSTLAWLRRSGVGSLKLADLIEISLLEEVAKDTSVDQEGPDEATEGSRQHRLIDSKLRLERKMAFLAKHTLPQHLTVIHRHEGESKPDDARPYLTIGSLLEDKLLTRGQAETATLLLCMSPAELHQLDPASAAKFLAVAEQLSGNVRAIVFRRLVRLLLLADDWKVTRSGLEWKVSKDDRAAVVAPVWAMTTKSKVPRRRLDRLKEAGPPKSDAILVVPDGSTFAKSDVPTVPFSALLDHL